MRVIWDVCSVFYRSSVAVVRNLHPRGAVVARVKLSFAAHIFKPGSGFGGLEAVSSHQGCDTLNNHKAVSAPAAVPIPYVAGLALYPRTVRTSLIFLSVMPHSSQLKPFLLLPAARRNHGAAVVRGDFPDRVAHDRPSTNPSDFSRCSSLFATRPCVHKRG